MTLQLCVYRGTPQRAHALASLIKEVSINRSTHISLSVFVSYGIFELRELDIVRQSPSLMADALARVR